MKTTFKSIVRSYSIWILIGCILAFLLRIVEIVIVSQRHFVPCLIGNEMLGWGVDVILFSAVLALLFLPYLLLCKWSFRAGNIFTGTLLSLLSVAHIAILQYFQELLQPLGGVLQGHTLQQIMFTALTSNVNLEPFVVFSVAAVVAVVALFFLLRKINLPVVAANIITIFSFCCIGFTALVDHYFSKFEGDALPHVVIANKSFTFYKPALYIRFQKERQEQALQIDYQNRNLLFPGKQFVSDDYPLLGKTAHEDVLGPYFQESDSLPNIVYIAVEGLAQMFMDEYHGVRFLPFLDSLAKESLYWTNTVTTSERSYGVAPSLLASTPYGKRNFAEESVKVRHFSIVNLLAKQRYYTSFFYGQPPWGHSKDAFLKRNGINRYAHSYTFPEKYAKIMVGDYFWGYDDLNLAAYATEVMDSLPDSPRLDVYYTGSMHPPFMLENEAYYQQKFDSIIACSDLSKQEKAFVEKYRRYLFTLPATDDALRNLFAYYRRQPYFENTIFVVVGDHPMYGIPFENALRKYYVPLIVYSPLLKKPDTFKSVNSYMDVTPTILSFLHHRYGMEIPPCDAFIGKTLDTCHDFRNTQPIIFMNTSRFIRDILADEYYLSNDRILYKVSDGFDLEQVENKRIKDSLLAMLANFRALNNFVCAENRLIPDTLYYRYAFRKPLLESFQKNYHMNKEEDILSVFPPIETRSDELFFFDFKTKDFNDKPDENYPILVIKASDAESKGSLFWMEFNLTKESGEVHYLIDLSDYSAKPILFESFFWNKHHVAMDVRSADCRFYSITNE